jgi:CheY-like chemotaxis protein/predicted regulator of Ras-like GTPase activity (Roadblock/LC7/MglB family)
MNEDMRKTQMLIVDDDRTVATILAESLQKVDSDYVIETAGSGDEALERVQQEKYQLVITDYKMPGMSGLDLVRGINAVSPETQVVLMTAYGTSELRETVGHLELSGYLDKPFTMEQIRDIVEKAVEHTSDDDDPYRSGDITVDEPLVRDLLEDLRADTQARCVLLLSSGGYPIEVAGATEHLEISNLSALVAANFMAAAELAKMLGSGSVFKSSYHEGTDYNIYAHDLDDDLLLAVITDSDRKAGTVWFYTKQAAGEISPLLEQELAAHGDQSVGDLTQGLDTALDDLFDEDSNGSECEGEEGGLMGMDEAASAGLVPEEWCEQE